MGDSISYNKTGTMITLDDFKMIPPGAVFAGGEVENSPTSEGIFLTDNRQGDLLRWIAVKGYGEDWAIYAHWADKPDEWIEQNGQKVYNIENIEKLVLCDRQVLKLYRR